MAEFTVEQARAIGCLDANVAVAAGAGAGKTRVLVERYINILAQGRAGCEEILAITFTNKAAKEMKERIASRASELAAAAADEAEGRRWRGVAGELEYAPIGTFHSFCARVLRENPVEAGLDPNFAVLDEVEAALLTERALGETVEAALAEEAEWLEGLLTAYDSALLMTAVPELYEKLAAQGLVADGLEERLAAPYREAVDRAGALKADLRRLCGELMAYREKLSRKAAQFTRVERLARDWEKVAAAIDGADAADESGVDAVFKEYLDCLDRRSGDKEIVGEMREVLRRLRQVRADRAALVLAPALGRLLLALDGAVARHKAELRALTFTDLEVRAARLLAFPAVRRRYQDRMRFIMVDEFQDTNDLQRQIVYLVAGGDAERLLGRKLFVVGDGKQSIYRFRGADVAVFERVRGDIAADGGEVIDLDVNFRSMDGLLTLYNECFSVVMGTAEDAVRFSPLASFRREAGEEQARAEFLAIARAGLPDGVTAREAEAAAVAGRIRMMAAAGEELVDRDGTARAVRYGDVAVLFRTAKDVEVYAAALQRTGVPYYIVGGRGFYRCQEVLDVLNLLRVVDNRCHETALAGVLRSPMFMLSDATLAVLKRDGQSLWQGLERSGLMAGLPEVERAGRVLAGLRAMRGLTGLAGIIRLALAETGYLNFVLTQFMGQQKYANLLKFVAVAEGFAAKGPVTLGDFLRYVTKLAEDDVQEGEAQVESEAGDTVKLMTIHKAKGLEFPVVFLPDLHRRFNAETGPVLYSPEAGLGLKAPGADGELTATSVHEAVAGRERQLALLELKRLLYVAFTRAKDYLVLSAVADKASAAKGFTELSSWLGWLGKVYGFDDFAALPDRLAVDKAAVVVRGKISGTDSAACRVGDDGPEAADEGWLDSLAGRIAALPARGPELVFPVSQMERYRRCPRAFYYSVVAGLPEPPAEYEGRPDRPPGRIIGDVLHRCLEIAAPGLAAEECVARAAGEKAPVRWRTAAAAEARPLLHNFLAGGLFREIGELPQKREWRFAYHLDDPAAGAVYSFTGRVDCLVLYPDGCCGIVDYKTDRVAAGGCGDKAAAYVLQLALYAMAAEAAGQGRVRDARLYFLRPGVTVPVAVDAAAREAAAAELLAVCRQVRRGGTEEDYAVNRGWCAQCGYRVLCREYQPGVEAL